MRTRISAGRLRDAVLTGRVAELRQLRRRSFEVVVVAAVLGAVTGLVVAALDGVIIGAIGERIFDLPIGVVALLPGVGITLSWLLLRTVGGGCSPATSDDFLHAFHDQEHSLPLRSWFARMLATVATIGLGNPMGLEGPSMYAGATLGAQLKRRFPRLVIERRTLITAGAAAGIAAIFKAPATGLVFALTVPYRDDIARRALLPASVAAASGYLVFVAIHGTAPLFHVTGEPRFSMGELAVALVVGVAAGLGARMFAKLVRHAKELQRIDPALRIPVAAAALAVLFVLGRLSTGDNMSMTSGYTVIAWVLDPKRTFAVLAAVLVIRCVAIAVTVGGGGVGGLFIPLVVGGALVGRMASEVTSVGSTTLLTVIGTAAFLGAGYRVPLAAVMFVAESTGRPGFIVPGLLAAVAAELVMGDASMTSYQLASGRPSPVTPATEPPPGAPPAPA